MPTGLSTANAERTHRRGQRTRQVLGEALRKFLQEDSLMVSASIAYHSLLAIFPMLLLLLGVSGIYIRRFELAGRLAIVLQRYLPVKTDFIMQNLVGISRAYGRIGLISFLLLLWSSSGVFLPLENALNRAWEVAQGRAWWRSRLLALEMAVVVACLILISTGVVAVEILFRNWLGRLLAPSLHPLVVFIYHLLTAASSFSVALLTFLILFQRLPHRAMRLRQAFPGALLTALVWEVARWLFTILLPFFNYRQVYGSIGVVVALMTWTYISSAVMLFGAQVSRSLYRTLTPSTPAPSLAAPVASTGSGAP
jgi:YihY family inner membrane protein